MSPDRLYCEIWLATDEKWYVLLESDDDCDFETESEQFGPFDSKDDAFVAARKRGRPSMISVDDSGVQNPPKSEAPTCGGLSP